MKKISIFIIVLALAGTCFSQQSEFQNNIEAKDQQICKLQNEVKQKIHEEWQRIQNDSLTKYPNDCLKQLNMEKGRWKDSIKTIQTRIDNLNNDSWVVNLRKYYQNGKIDQLYANADIKSLSTHKNILGVDHPKVMDELEILLKCSELLNMEYNESDNQAYQKQLKEVSECDTKKSLQYLLSQHKDITDEVNEWLKDDKEHTLFGMRKFYNELENDFKVAFEKDYPYLAQKVRDKVMKKMKQHSSER